MADNSSDLLDLSLHIDVDDDSATAYKKIQGFAEVCAKAGLSVDETRRRIEEYLSRMPQYVDAATGALNNAGQTLLKIFDSEAPKKNLQDTGAEIDKLTRKLRDIGKGFNPFDFLSPKKGLNLGGMLSKLAESKASIAPIGNLFANYRAVWNFVDGIAELNKEMMRLAYTSGMGAGELKNLGNAASAFGGSAATIAKGNERFVKTVEDMKRGGGMGFLGNIAYKYGFMADLGADWQSNTQRAIAMARQMDVNTRMAFLKEFDPANYRQNIAYASMDEGKYQSYMARMNTPEKAEAAEGAATATEDFLLSTNQLSSAWQEICDKLAEFLLPIMEKVVDFITFIVEAIASLPGWLTGIVTIAGVLAATILTIRKTLAIINALKTTYTAIQTASVALSKKEGEETTKNTAKTWAGVTAELAKTFAKNPLLGAVAVAGVLAIAGGAVAVGAYNYIDNKEKEKAAAQERQRKYDEENISLSDVASGKRELTPLEMWAFGINDERLMRNAVKTLTPDEAAKEKSAATMGIEQERIQNALDFNKSLETLTDAANSAAEAMGRTAAAARDVTNDISMDAWASEANNIFSKTVASTSNQTNISMNNNFENATSEQVDIAIEQFSATLQQASRSGVVS